MPSHDLTLYAFAFYPCLSASPGQVIFGLATFQFGDPRHFCCHKPSPSNEEDEELNLKVSASHEPANARSASLTIITPESVPDKHCYCPNRLTILFMGTLLWNAFFTLAIAWMPLDNQISSYTDSQPLSLFRLPAGRGLAAAAFMVGISNGGIYVLYPQILVDVVGHQLWPAALSIFLVVNGVMNLTGTLLAAKVYSLMNSYRIAFFLGGIFPLVGFLLFFIQHLIACVCRCGSNSSSHTKTVSSPENEGLGNGR